MLLCQSCLAPARNRNDLQLDGPFLQFDDKSDFMSLGATRGTSLELQIGFDLDNVESFDQFYAANNGEPLKIAKSIYKANFLDTPLTLEAGMKHRQIEKVLPPLLTDALERTKQVSEPEFCIDSQFGFLAVKLIAAETSSEIGAPVRAVSPGFYFVRPLQHFVYVPGLRAKPNRTYPFYSGNTLGSFGRIDAEAATLVHRWQSTGSDKLNLLSDILLDIGLASHIRTTQKDDTKLSVEIPRALGRASSEQHYVNLADVGFGVSQALPVIVALLSSDPGHIVYLEQPEVHLHPRAQEALAKFICQTVKRGVQVIVETHSDLMLMTIQTEVARGAFEHKDVALHWFKRDSTSGDSTIDSAVLDESGSFGDWPEDFSSVSLDAELAYLKSSRYRQGASD